VALVRRLNTKGFGKTRPYCPSRSIRHGRKTRSKASRHFRGTAPGHDDEQDATRRVLVKKGLLTNDEVLEEIKVVRREFGGEIRRSDV